MSQQFDVRTDTLPAFGAGPGSRNRWRSPLLGAAALLLAGAVLAPWARATVPPPPHFPPVPPFPLTADVDGLNAGAGLWGWLTLLCAVAIAALAMTGAVRRTAGATAAAVAPAVGALAALLVAVPGLLHQKLPDDVKLSVLGKNASPMQRHFLFITLDEHTQATLGWGWLAALLGALLALALGVSALVTRRHR